MVEGKEPKRTNGGCFFKLFIGPGFTPPFLRGRRGKKIPITSFTYHLSNSLSKSDIIASTWNCYSMTEFLSIKPPVGVLSPLCLPRAIEPFLG
jgi:hypothetical protein